MAAKMPPPSAAPGRKRGPAPLLGAALGLVLLGAAAAVLGPPLMELAAQPERFRGWIESRGLSARLTYLGMVLLQVVVAVIPGEPLEILGGYAFGMAEGTVLFCVGATLGGVLVFGLVRTFGVRLVRVFFGADKLERLHFLKNSPRREILFLLVFMIPGTPKDLLCYFAGLTDMKWGTWLLICSFGRIPSVVTSTVGGGALGEGSYLLAAAVFGGALAVSACGLWVYQKICDKNR